MRGKRNCYLHHTPSFCCCLYTVVSREVPTVVFQAMMHRVCNINDRVTMILCIVTIPKMIQLFSQLTRVMGDATLDENHDQKNTKHAGI